MHLPHPHASVPPRARTPVSGNELPPLRLGTASPRPGSGGFNSPLVRVGTPDRDSFWQLKGVFRVISSKMFDPASVSFVYDKIIAVHGPSGVILSVDDMPSDLVLKSTDVDLRGMTVLPGLIDAHVHLFLHTYGETSWAEQTTSETIVERTVRATNHARRTLMAGFTAVRDLGTEGAQDSDTALRACISKPQCLIPGPRYFIANRAIVSTGSYGPRSNLWLDREGVEGFLGAEAVDGIEACRKAVRRQHGAGADWIKIYGDYRVKARQLPSMESMDSFPVFSREEMKVMIDTAHTLGTRVAVHAINESTVLTAIELGADTIEHGSLLTSRGLDELENTKTIWNPTLSVVVTNKDTVGKPYFDNVIANFKAVVDRAVAGKMRLAVGGDTGPYPHGNNALELQLMHKYGAPPLHVLRWATMGNWEAIRGMYWEGQTGEDKLKKLSSLSNNELVRFTNSAGDNGVPLGQLRRGFAADIIAVAGDVEQDFERAISSDSVKFVMKAGTVYKRDGVPTLQP
ncbi:hypothetical protein BKA62DRAFT_669325 [Auriculariales sp. MPI-PUGE-AT-0066]|nr:hypothetical protein BKA62DRAFT_669325 [Auriculariales sp. MPI-PUGE-AT-0066]